MTMKIALVLLVATNLIGHLQASVSYCENDEFQLVSPAGAGIQSGCKTLDHKFLSLEDCKNFTCSFENGNTFNFVPETGGCTVKKCNNQKLKLQQGTPWKNRAVYSLTKDESVACTGPFVRIPFDSAEAIGNCVKIHTARKIDTLEDCRANTCRFGGNAFAYNGSESECQSKVCEPIQIKRDDSTKEGTYEVWIQECKEGDVRLIDGPNDNEGVAQICLNNKWGYICDQPGLHKNGWPGVLCKQKNGPNSEAESIKLIKKFKNPKFDLDKSFPILLEAPACNINKHTDITECPHNPKTDVCKGNLQQKYGKTAFIKCST